MASCYDLCQFPQPPSGDYRCPVDGGVLRDAVRSNKCGHLFGMQCILTYLLKVKENCPVCSASMDVSNLEPAEAVRRKVLALPMSCRELDCCTWVGPVQDEPAHAHGPYCGVYMVQCPFCELRVNEGEAFEAHKAECPEAIVVCDLCYEDMPRKEFSMHQNGLGGRICRLTTPMKRQKEAAMANVKAKLEEAERRQQVQQEMEKMERMSFHQSMGTAAFGTPEHHPKGPSGDHPSIIKDDADVEEAQTTDAKNDADVPEANAGVDSNEQSTKAEERSVEEFFSQLPTTVDGVQAALFDLTKRHEDLERRHYLLQQTVHDLIDYISSRDMGSAPNSRPLSASAAGRGPSLPNKIPHEAAPQPRQYRSVKPLAGNMAKKAAFEYVFSGMRKESQHATDVTPPRQLFGGQRGNSPQPGNPGHLPPISNANGKSGQAKDRPVTSPLSSTKNVATGRSSVFTETKATNKSHKPKAPSAPSANNEAGYKRSSVSLASSASSVNASTTTTPTSVRDNGKGATKATSKMAAAHPSISITTPSSTKKASAKHSLSIPSASPTPTSATQKSPIQYTHKISHGKPVTASPK